MSYEDEIGSIFGNGTIEAETPYQIARRQLNDSKNRYYNEGPEGTFRTCGLRFGCGFAEGVATVDPVSGLAEVDIDTNLHVSPDNVKNLRKLLRYLNRSLILEGLVVDDEGWVHFHPEPADLLGGDDLDEWFGKGFSTIHEHAGIVAQIEAGRAPWNVKRAIDRPSANNDSDGDGDGGSLLDTLRGLLN